MKAVGELAERSCRPRRVRMVWVVRERGLMYALESGEVRVMTGTPMKSESSAMAWGLLRKGAREMAGGGRGAKGGSRGWGGWRRMGVGGIGWCWRKFRGGGG